MKTTLNRINGTSDIAENAISKLEDIALSKIKQNEKKYFLKNRFFRCVETANELIWVLNQDGRWRAQELFEEIMVKIFPNLFNNINSHIKEAQWNPNRINMKKTVPCHIMVKLLKTSYEAVRAGKHIKHRVSKIRMIADISSFNNAGDINAGRVNLSNKKKIYK